MIVLAALSLEAAPEPAALSIGLPWCGFWVAAESCLSTCNSSLRQHHAVLEFDGHCQVRAALMAIVKLERLDVYFWQCASLAIAFLKLQLLLSWCSAAT
jgi:hypothetical protein